MRGKWVLYSAAVILFGVLGATVAVLQRKPAANAVAPSAAAPQSLASPTEISLPARIEAQDVITVGQDASGDVQAFLADAGQQVFEGQVLARLSNQGLEASRQAAAEASEAAQSRAGRLETEIVSARLEASRARADATRSRVDYERAESTYRRQKTLNDAGATPRLVYEKAEREFETAQSEYRSLDELARQAESRVQALNEQLQSARKLLDDKSRALDDASATLQAMEVRSPADGLVVARRGEVGKPFQSGTGMFEIAVNPGKLQAVVTAEPTFITRLQSGQEALVIVADLQQGLPGAIKQLRNSEVVVAFMSPTPVIHPGMTAQVRFTLK